MAYSTAEQVADEFNGVAFDATSNPTLDTVNRWIDEADALINSKLRIRYVYPLAPPLDPATESALILRQISVLLVSARVRRRLNRVGPTGETAKQIDVDTHNLASKMLDKIVSGDLILPDFNQLQDSIGVGTHVSCGAEYIFKRNTEQW